MLAMGLQCRCLAVTRMRDKYTMCMVIIRNVRFILTLQLTNQLNTKKQSNEKAKQKSKKRKNDGNVRE